MRRMHEDVHKTIKAKYVFVHTLYFSPILCSGGESASRSPNSNADLQILFTILSVFQKNNKVYDRSLSNRSVKCLSGLQARMCNVCTT